MYVPVTDSGASEVVEDFGQQIIQNNGNDEGMESMAVAGTSGTSFSMLLEKLRAKKKQTQINKQKEANINTQPVVYECRMTEEGFDYHGHLNTTRYGKKCQRWSEQFPHFHPYTNDTMFPADGSVDAAGNYCRNPDPNYKNGVWCLTMDKFVRWEPCDVPRCSFDY